MDVRHALDDRLIHIVTLEMERKYDEALACLDDILEANRPRDHDQWLARSIAMHRCNILADARRYAEAEKACEAWAQLGFMDVSRRWMHANTKAKVLDAQGRTREALALLEEAVGYQSNRDLPSARLVLGPLVEISKKMDQPVTPKARPLAEAYAWVYGIEMPVADSLGKAIQALVQTAQSMQPLDARYTQEDEPA